MTHSVKYYRDKAAHFARKNRNPLTSPLSDGTTLNFENYDLQLVLAVQTIDDLMVHYGRAANGVEDRYFGLFKRHLSHTDDALCIMKKIGSQITFNSHLSIEDFERTKSEIISELANIVKRPRFNPKGDFANMCRAIILEMGPLSWNFDKDFMDILGMSPRSSQEFGLRK